MRNSDLTSPMQRNNCPEKIHPTARVYRKRPLLAAICLLLVLCAFGCSGEVQAPALQVQLSRPEISGREVSVNGGVPVPLERIQWDWGDGQVEKHHFFPASHTYKNPGGYRITVTVFGKNNTSVSKSVSVEIQQKTLP